MDVVFDINLITVPIKIMGFWLLLEVYKPNVQLTSLLELSVKRSNFDSGIYANIALLGFGIGISLIK